jgi:hypothetical protein
MRPKKCNNCGKIIENRNSTLVVWCSSLCAIAIANKRKASKRKKETQQMKVDIRSHADWIAILQEEINLLVRTIDRGWPCISSGVIECQFHAGHFFARSTHPALRFHLHNIWAQSAYDNGQREGNRNGYIEGLKNLYGEGYGFIEHLPRIYPSRKWAKDELIDALKVVKRCIKKVPNRRLSKEERWEFRDLFNDEIKLY